MASVNVGEVLGSYRITGQLGEGGVGVVYLASHKLIGREAAIKVLRPEFSNDHNIVEQFFDDAKKTTSLNHPGIVDIYDFGYSDGGSPFLVMERLDGESLASRLERLGGLGVKESMVIARQICGALAAAHERGVVHRGLKPENVFVVSDAENPGQERVKILDFGASKLRGGNDAHLFKTASGHIMGAPSYMAPEQCLGSARVDHRVDLYAVGCILFHMLCGRPPFVGTAVAQVLSAHVNMTPPQPKSIAPGIPGDVEKLIMRLLEKSPEKRYKNAGMLAGAIDELTDRMPDGPKVAVGSSPVAGKMLPAAQARDDSTVMAGGAVPVPQQQVSELSAELRRPPMPPPPQQPRSRPSVEELPLVYGPPPDDSDQYVYDGGIRKKDSESTLRGAAGSRDVAGDRERRSWLGVVVVLLALAGGGVSAYFIATSTEVSADSEAVAADETSSEASETPESAEVAADDKGTETAADAGAQVAGKTESVVMVFVTINSNPEGAQVFLDDKKVGFTPYRAEVASKSDNSTYVLKLADHKDAEVTLPGDRSAAETVQLQKGQGTAEPVNATPAADAGPDGSKPETAPEKPQAVLQASDNPARPDSAGPRPKRVKPRPKRKPPRTRPKKDDDFEEGFEDDEDDFEEGFEDDDDSGSKKEEEGVDEEFAD